MLIAIVKWFFPCIRFFKIIYEVFQVQFNFSKVFFDWKGIITITIMFIFNIIYLLLIYHLLLLVFNSLFLFRKILNIVKYSVFDWFIFFFFSLKVFLMFLIMLSSDIFLFLVSLVSFHHYSHFWYVLVLL